RAGLARRPAVYRWSTTNLAVGLEGGCLPRRTWTPSGFYQAFAAGGERRAREYEAWLDAVTRPGARGDTLAELSRARLPSRMRGPRHSQALPRHRPYEL